MGNMVSNESVDDFDLNSIFMDSGSDPVGSDEDTYESELPYWRVSREDIKKVLQVIASFPSRSTVFMAVWKDGANLCIHANNRDAFIDSKIAILNDKPFETDKVYFLDTNKLLAFINSYKQFVFSFGENGVINYESPYVTYTLDTLKMSLDEIRIKCPDVGKWIQFPLTKDEVGTFKTLYGFAVKLSDSKVLIDSNKSEAFYTLYKYMVNNALKEVSEEVIIRRLDLPTIHEIVGDSLLFAYTKDRLFFKFNLGVVSFLRVPFVKDDFMYPDSFATGKEVGKFHLDIPIVKRAFKLSSLFNVEDVVFYSSGSDIFMGASERVKFKVGSGQLSENFSMGVDTLSKLLGTVSDGEGSVAVMVTEHGVDITLGKGEVYSLSRVSVSQIKRGDKDVQRLGTQMTSTSQSASKPVMQEKAPVAEFQDVEIL